MSVMALRDVLSIIEDKVAKEFRLDTLNKQVNSLVLDRDDTMFAIAYAVGKEYNLSIEDQVKLEGRLKKQWPDIKKDFDTLAKAKSKPGGKLISTDSKPNEIVIIRFDSKNNYGSINDAINRSNGALYTPFWGRLMPIIKKFLAFREIKEKQKPEFKMIMQNSGPKKGKTAQVPTGKMISALTAGSLINLGHYEGSNIEYLAADAFQKNMNGRTLADLSKIMKMIPDGVKGIEDHKDVEINILTGLSSRMTMDSTTDFRKTVTLVFEYSVENQRRGSTEEIKIRPAIVDYINKVIDNADKIDWIDQEASDNAITIADKKVLQVALKAGFKSNRDPKINAKPAKAKVKRNIVLKNQRNRAKMTSTNTKAKVIKAPQAMPSYLSLITLINKRLPPQVRSNMGGSRLYNRTGRLSESAVVTNITPTPQGYPSIEYNYQRDPYDVFDKTKGKAPWNTPGRDPSELVSMSVRQIAIELGMSRFYTRRAQ